MRKLLFIIICTISSTVVNAQTVDTIKSDTSFYFKVDKAPDVKGGFKELFKYLDRNLKYPKEAKKNNIQGTVRVNFIVERDGSLSDVKIGKSLSPETDAEAIRLMTDSKAPVWLPGAVNGKPVRVQYSIPIYFKLDN